MNAAEDHYRARIAAIEAAKKPAPPPSERGAAYDRQRQHRALGIGVQRPTHPHLALVATAPLAVVPPPEPPSHMAEIVSPSLPARLPHDGIGVASPAPPAVDVYDTLRERMERTCVAITGAPIVVRAPRGAVGLGDMTTNAEGRPVFRSETWRDPIDVWGLGQAAATPVAPPQPAPSWFEANKSYIILGGVVAVGTILLSLAVAAPSKKRRR